MYGKMSPHAKAFMGRAPATTLRAKRFGRGNQISYEADEAVERQRMKATLAQQNKEARAGAAIAKRKTRSTTGANAGTLGGTRSLRNAFFR